MSEEIKPKRKMNILYSKQAIKSIGRFDSRMKQRIKAAIEGLPDGDTK